MRPTSLFAVLFGSGVGVAAAIGGYTDTPDAPPQLGPAAARPVHARNEASSPSHRDAARKIAASSVSPTEAPPLEDDPPIRSKEEFQAAAVACDEKDAGACRRAALAAELGDVVPKDPNRAKTFRKVELTALVRACEKGGVDACLVLADRYLRGDGLAQSDRTATALIDHARALCAKKLEPACGRVPSN
jgi:TPR repeat protein